MATLQSLAGELIIRIAGYLGPGELLAIRQTCRSLEQYSFDFFASEFFTTIGFLTLPKGLDVLEQVSKHPQLHKYVRHVWTVPDMSWMYGHAFWTSDDAKEEREQLMKRLDTDDGKIFIKQALWLAAQNDEAMHRLTATDFLSRIAKSFVNVSTVGLCWYEDFDDIDIHGHHFSSWQRGPPVHPQRLQERFWGTKALRRCVPSSSLSWTVKLCSNPTSNATVLLARLCQSMHESNSTLRAPGIPGLDGCRPVPLLFTAVEASIWSPQTLQHLREIHLCVSTESGLRTHLVSFLNNCTTLKNLHLTTLSRRDLAYDDSESWDVEANECTTHVLQEVVIPGLIHFRLNSPIPDVSDLDTFLSRARQAVTHVTISGEQAFDQQGIKRVYSRLYEPLRQKYGVKYFRVREACTAVSLSKRPQNRHLYDDWEDKVIRTFKEDYEDTCMDLLLCDEGARFLASRWDERHFFVETYEEWRNLRPEVF